MKSTQELVGEKKLSIQGYFNELESLKKYCVNTLNHISSKYRNTRAVAKTY